MLLDASDEMKQIIHQKRGYRSKLGSFDVFTIIMNDDEQPFFGNDLITIVNVIKNMFLDLI